MTMVPSSGSRPDIGSFEFHGDTVTVITDEQGSWAVLGQLSQNLTLDPNGQRQMIERKSWSRGKTCVTHVMLPRQNRAYPQFLIHERIVPMWLANITSSRIADETKRAKVEKAQVELADAMYAYVSGRSSQVARREPSKLELARDLVSALEAQETLTARVKELEPSAQAWDVLASASGDFSLRDAALILNRDPNITAGQNLLMKELGRLGMVDRWGVPYAKHKQHLTERPRTYTDRDTGEERQAKPQIRITTLGLRYLHGKLGGVAPLRFEQTALSDA